MSNDEWVNKDVRVPDGSYLASSHETPGAERALLFDRESGNNLGPAEVRDPESQSDSDKAIRDAILIAVGAAVTFVAVKAPEMKRGLDEKVLPAIKAKWTAFRSRKSDSPATKTDDEPSNTVTRPHLAVVKDEDAAA
ncbi:hypothetical protein GCM10023063_16390 [Arthrobacter methylotrophus]|uniref:Uncharacterized protein n=1 Tax=Arthrobacter methylotrophus TaxID=121291 RepID=A0ABV5UNG2_9MICC